MGKNRGHITAQVVFLRGGRNRDTGKTPADGQEFWPRVGKGITCCRLQALSGELTNRRACSFKTEKGLDVGLLATPYGNALRNWLCCAV